MLRIQLMHAWQVPGHRQYFLTSFKILFVFAAAGDTFVAVSNAQGVPLNALIEANPQVADPGMVYAGELFHRLVAAYRPDDSRREYRLLQRPHSATH